jgi:hypothetical protein
MGTIHGFWARSQASEPLEHAVHDDLHVAGPAVETGASLAGLLIDVPAELRGDHHLASERRDGLAEDPLGFMRAVGFGRVEERDTTIEGGPDDVDHLRAVRHRRLILAADVLNAEADARDFQRSEFSPSGHLWCAPGCSGRLRVDGRVRAAENRGSCETSCRSEEVAAPYPGIIFLGHFQSPPLFLNAHACRGLPSYSCHPA